MIGKQVEITFNNEPSMIVNTTFTSLTTTNYLIDNDLKQLSLININRSS
jgi:hypothetical protein